MDWFVRLFWLLPFLAVLAIFSWGSVEAGLHSERWYQNAWCADNEGEAEVKLSDGTRADCLTEDYAIEFDFSRKWAEAIGQAQHYAAITGLKPGIVLIVEDAEKEWRNVDRLRHTLKSICPAIRLWIISP